MRFPISSYRKTWKNQEICRRLLQNQEKIILSSQLTLTPILCWAKTCARDLQTVCATTKTCSGHSSKQSISIERLQHCCCCPCCNPEYKKKPCNRTLCLWAIDAGKRQTWIEHVTIRTLRCWWYRVEIFEHMNQQFWQNFVPSLFLARAHFARFTNFQYCTKFWVQFWAQYWS